MARSAAFGAVPLARPPYTREPGREAEEHPLAAPEWTLPARHVAVLALAALAVSAGLAAIL